MQRLSLLVVIAASFFVATRFHYFSPSHFSSPIWPASGIAIGMLGLFGRKFWPGIFLGAILSHLLQGSSILVTLGLSLSNTIEAIFALSIIGHIKSLKNTPVEQKTPLAYLLGAVGGGLTGASLGMLTLTPAGLIDLKTWDDIWISWSIGHALGILLIVPVFSAIKERSSLQIFFRKKIESSLLLILIISSCSLILLRPSDPVYLFLFGPLLLLVAVRTGHSGIKIAALLISAFALWGNLAGTGPYVHLSPQENLIRMQLFLCMTSFTMLILTGLKKSETLKIPGVVLLVSWLATLIIYLSFRTTEEKKDLQRFDKIIENSTKGIIDRISIYEDALRGVMSLIMSSNIVTKEEWDSYSSLTRVKERYPGISNMGVVWVVKRKDEKDFILKEKKKGMPDFNINVAEKSPIPGYLNSSQPRYVVSYSWKPNVQGRDLGAEKIRRLTFNKARDSGLTSLSDKVYSSADNSPSFLMAYPFYKDGTIPETLEERRKNIEGFVYAFFVADPFFNHILGEKEVEIEMKVLDSQNNLLFSSVPEKSAGPHFEKTTTLQINLHQMTFMWRKSPFFQSAHDSTTAWIAFFGIVFSLLLAVIVAGIQESQRKAFKIEKLEVDKQATIMASKLKSDFLANMSHEIRTPITGMIGMTELLMETPLNPAQKDYAKALKSSGDALLSMVNGVLDFSKIEAGKLEFESLDFELSPLLKSIESSFFVMARNKGLKLIMEKDENMPEWFKGDPSRLLQIFINLVSNAIKFSDIGYIKFKSRLSGLENGMAKLRFEVEDQGIGISPEVQSSLFRPFTQGDSSTSRRFGGTGLGLSISRNLVEGMGGKIGVNSKENEGSLFWVEITLPLGTKVPQKSGFSEISIKEKKLKVLIAEDNIINQKVTVKMFKKMGAEAHVVGNGMEVLESLQRQTYDLVMMDCQMPMMDGYEATHLFRNSQFILNKEIPIVALTANATIQSREKCLESGMNNFLPKPIVYEELKKVVMQSIKSRIDLHAVNKIKEFNQDDNLLNELISLYLNNGPEAVDKMSSSYLQEDWNSIREEAHKLKSSSLMIGARVVADICEKVETDIENGKTDDVHVSLRDLKREIGKALAELKQLA